jgi:hypothetical protein
MVVLAGLTMSCSHAKPGVELKTVGSKQILVDKDGNEVIGSDHPYQYIKENLPHDDVLWVQQNDKWAFFDLSGNQLTPFIFDAMHPANVCSNKPTFWFCRDMRWFYKGLTVVEKDNQFAVMNRNMEYEVSWGEYDYISPLNIHGFMIVKKDKKFGLLNHKMKLVQPLVFDSISNKPALNREQDYPTFRGKRQDRYFIFDTLGNIIEKDGYDIIVPLQKNNYLVTKAELKWRIDKLGNKIEDDFSILYENGSGFIAEKDSLLGFVDKTGKTIIPLEYEDISPAIRGSWFVKKNEKWGAIIRGQQTIPFQYDFITNSFEKDNYIVVQNDKFGKINEKGEEIFPCKYDGITTWVEYGPNGHYVMIDNKMGLIRHDGSEVIPAIFDRVHWIDTTPWIKIWNAGKVGLYDMRQNDFLLPLEYDIVIVDKDWYEFEKDKPTQIITYKEGDINILDEQGNIMRTGVPKEEFSDKYDFDNDTDLNSAYSYTLSIMLHNRTYNVPDWHKESLEKKGKPVESVYYKMSWWRDVIKE